MVLLHGGRPIVSFTFDDFPRSAAQVGAEILQRYGARGTYYVSMGLRGTLLPAGPGFEINDLQHLECDGHELGCHTFDHCHSWKACSGNFEKSVLKNAKAVREAIPNLRFETLSYPLAYPRPSTKRRMSKHFACCRAGGESFNVGWCDANNLQAVFLEKNRDRLDAMKELIEANRRANGWLIFATHDIAESPTPFGCRPTFFDDIVKHVVECDSQILPVAKAWALLAARV